MDTFFEKPYNNSKYNWKKGDKIFPIKQRLKVKFGAAFP